MEEKESVKSTTTKKTTTRPNNKKKLSTISKILIVIIIAVIIFFVVKLCLSLGKGKDNQNNDNNNTTTNEQGDSLVGQVDFDLSNTTNVTVADGVKTNNSTELAKEKKYDGLVFKDIVVKADSMSTVLNATVVNNTGKDYAQKYALAQFVDKDGNVIFDLPILISDVANGETTTIDASANVDFSNASDFKILDNPDM